MARHKALALLSPYPYHLTYSSPRQESRAEHQRSAVAPPVSSWLLLPIASRSSCCSRSD